MIYGSVCSGIEAASVAWEPLGWRAGFFSEIEAFPRAVLKHRYPYVPLHGDFTTIKENDYGTIDLLVGGTPCQSFSIAGLRKGLSDDRGNLTLEFLLLAARQRASWLVWENVPGILSIEGGRVFGTFLNGLAECGYGFAYRILDAQHFGVPQRRRRVFVIGYLGNWRPAAAVLFERESLRGDITPRREARQSVAPTIAARTKGSGGLGTDFDCGGGLIAHTLRGEGFDASEDGTGRGVSLAFGGNNMAGCIDVAAGLNARSTQRQDFETETLVIPIHAQAIRSEKGGANRDDDGRVNGLGIGNAGDPANTVTCSENHAIASFKPGQSAAAAGIGYQENIAPMLEGGGGGNNQPAILQQAAVRRLTPRECERLQGFPDDYTLIPIGKRLAADGPRYKALGNSMAVPVMRWLGERIDMVQSLMDEGLCL